MELDPDVCYRAVRTRDARFDGRFFTAVRSTGVYCRPICPARPKRENCLFVPCAAAAQELGFRPCLRCRPEASPGTPAWLGTSATVSRGLRLIAAGALDEGGVEGLARRLGVGERHLRRLFVEHLGAPPISVAQNRRVLFAKKLIDETSLPLAAIAFSAGFSSVRRFNDSMKRAFGRSPSALRRSERPAVSTSELRLRLAYRPPFDWRGVVDVLAACATPGVETVSPEAYRRTIDTGGQHGLLEVRPVPGHDSLECRIALSGATPLIHVAERIKRIFDLGSDPHEIHTHLASDPALRPALRASCGVRVPGAWSGFELAVRSILGHGVGVRTALRRARALARAHGQELRLAGAPDGGGPESLDRIFPTAEALATADLSHLGLPGEKVRAIRAVARGVSSGGIELEGTRLPEEGMRALAAVAGIAPAIEQIIAMRALREPDAFPADDLGLRRALATSGRPLSTGALERASQSWRPWRAYAAVALWTRAARCA